MPESKACIELRRHLAHHGLPAERLDRIVNEFAEHWQDLKADALDDGLSETAATVRADTRLGEPGQLAANVIDGLRRTSGLGRHPLFALCVVPLFLPLLLMSAVAFPLFWLSEATHLAAWGDPKGLSARFAASSLWALHYASMFASVAWLARRSWLSGLGLRFIIALCSWCALTALLRFFDADPIRRNVAVGLTFPWRLNAHTAAILCLHVMMAGWFFVAARKARVADGFERGTIEEMPDEPSCREKIQL
jgi:hypothetical protein